MQTLSQKVPDESQLHSKDELLKELSSCGGHHFFLKNKPSLNQLVSPGVSYFFSKIRNSNDGRCYSIINCNSDNEKDGFLLSFGAKGSACLTDYSKLPLMVIRGNQLATILGSFKICPVQPTLSLSTSKILLKLPANLTFSKSKGNKAIISIGSAKPEKTIFNWTYQMDDSWRLTSASHPLHTIATFRYTNTLSTGLTPLLDFYIDLPRDLALLFIISVGFLVYK